MRIDLNDVLRASVPSTDKDGMLFRYDGKLLRAASAELTASLRLVLKHERLFELGLCRFRETRYQVDGFAAVFEADEVPAPLQPAEWPTRMIQAAACSMLELALELDSLGLGLKDAHPWNLLFDGPNPVFVDLGSIRPGPTLNRGWLEEFRRHLLLPLTLHSVGLHGPADAIMSEHLGVIKRFNDFGPLPYLVPPTTGYWLMRAKLNHRRALQKLRSHVERLDARGRKMAWSDYGSVEIPLGDKSKYTGKQASVDQFLGRLRPGRVLDLACNTGWFSRLAVSHGNAVTGVDIDDRALGVLYEKSLATQAPILAGRMDVTMPLGNFGMALAFPDAYTRLQGDTVMAIALVHHLARQGVPFSTLARILHQLGRRAAIVEFIPKTDQYVSRWPLAKEPWYTAQGLEQAMGAYFSKVSVLDSEPAGRRMYLFER
jgi:SAM-dependent methyltransferase